MEKARTRASESDPEDWITNILFELKLKGLPGSVKRKESEQKERVEGSSQSVRGPEATRGHPDLGTTWGWMGWRAQQGPGHSMPCMLILHYPLHVTVHD